MNHRPVVCIVALALVLAGCATSGEEAGKTEPGKSGASQGNPEEVENEAAQETARPLEPWVEKRVSKAKKRLTESKPGKIVWKCIEAHGGLANWYRNGPLFFHYNYQPVSGRTPRNTYQTIDTWSARARHEMASNRDREYGWDGERAWYAPPDWEPPYDVKFWALTPYYFVGMPFVLADPGLTLSYQGQDDIEGTLYDVVRVTFGHVGISPDDFYVLYIEPKSHRLGALRYIVSYPKYFPEGGHSPEKLMTYDGAQRIGGILFAQRYRFYMWDPEKKTDTKKVTDATLDSVEFRPKTPETYFAIPTNAKMIGNDEETNEDDSQ